MKTICMCVLLLEYISFFFKLFKSMVPKKINNNLQGNHHENSWVSEWASRLVSSQGDPAPSPTTGSVQNVMIFE